jgi:hypothetical protein
VRAFFEFEIPAHKKKPRRTATQCGGIAEKDSLPTTHTPPVALTVVLVMMKE